jgi:hypothetical protein
VPRRVERDDPMSNLPVFPQYRKVFRLLQVPLARRSSMADAIHGPWTEQ